MKYAAQEHTCEHLKQENQHLVQKLQKLEGEHNRLMAVYGTVIQQLSQLHIKCLGEVDAMKKQAAEFSEAVTTKTVKASGLKDEKDSLQTMLDEITEELERQKIQVLHDSQPSCRVCMECGR
ncbi:MAG: hypothetical protein MJE68_33895 [Proteobacteria bacterium]|nr:hypothetical protein [Pseudomonadota bacterium]